MEAATNNLLTCKASKPSISNRKEKKRLIDEACLFPFPPEKESGLAIGKKCYCNAPAQLGDSSVKLVVQQEIKWKGQAWISITKSSLDEWLQPPSMTVGSCVAENGIE